MPNPSIPSITAQASVSASLSTAIAQSAQRTGVDFNYLLGQAQLESGMRPDAKASTSSATGLFQFIEQTWLGLVKDKGEDYGLGWAANAISANGNGKLVVADDALKSSILELRNNPALASNLAAEFASDNSAYLQSRTGRKPESVDLYLAHFLGPAGAAKFLSCLNQNPDAAAAPSFMSAARSNRSIFYDRSGAPRSFQDIRDRFDSKLSNAVATAAGGTSGGIAGGKTLPPGGTVLPPAASGPKMVQPADYLRIAKNHVNDQKQSTTSNPINEPARAAYLMLASLGMK